MCFVLVFIFFENKFEIRKVIQIQKLNRKLKEENITKKKERFLIKIVKNRYFFRSIPKI